VVSIFLVYFIKKLYILLVYRGGWRIEIDLLRSHY